MDSERDKRYAEKIELAEERMANVQEWGANKEDLKSRMATYKAFQELAKAMLDIASMICKDMGKSVKDDYANIETLKNIRIVDGKTAKALAEINGLRNRIVHEYNGIRYDVFSESTERLAEDAEKFLETVRGWIEKNSGK